VVPVYQNQYCKPTVVGLWTKPGFDIRMEDRFLLDARQNRPCVRDPGKWRRWGLAIGVENRYALEKMPRVMITGS
jgi:hypothetical protein